VDGCRAREVTLSPEALPRIRRRPPPPLPRSWALTVGAGWPLLVVVMLALTPEPANPEAVPTLVDSLVFLAVGVGLVGTVGAAVARQYTALVWSNGLGLVWVATTIACPLSGHHESVGWQWAVDLASSGGLLLLGLVGARRLRAVARFQGLRVK
jgi:hypothetical protein